MNKQLLQWLMFFIPWLTLIFLKKDVIKRYMPVALFSSLTSIIVHELGVSFGWWTVLEEGYPLQLAPYLIGLMPVITLWIFRFTFRRFRWYLAVEIVFNLGFNVLFLGLFLRAVGILQLNLNPFLSTLLTISHGMLLYAYQLWQDGICKSGKAVQ